MALLGMALLGTAGCFWHFWHEGTFPAKAVSRCACHRTDFGWPVRGQCMECGGRVRHERRHRFGWATTTHGPCTHHSVEDRRRC
jgi:hypothetical protein